MKVKKIVLAMTIVWACAASAQDYPLGIRAQAMGGSGVSLAKDAEGQYHNPALLAELATFNATLFYSRLFGLSELPLSSAAVAGRLGKFGLGGSAVRLGHDLFHEQLFQLALAHAWQFRTARPGAGTSSMSFGMQFVLKQTRIAQYGEQQTLLVNIGVLAHLSEQWAWGMAAGNLLGAKTGGTQERLPRHVTLGLSYAPDARFAAQVDLYKQSDFSPEWRIGFEVGVLAPLLLRLGINENPDRFTCGLALLTRPLIVHVTAFSHVDLGWTQQMAITLRR